LQTALHRPFVKAAEPDDSEYGDAAYCGTALHRPVVKPLSEEEDSENGDATHCGTALHRSIAETVEEQEILMQETLLLVDSSSQINCLSSKGSS